MVFTKYPNELDDSTTLPPAVDLVTPVKAEAVNRLRDAILAMQQELDTQPSGTFGTVKDRFNSIHAQINTTIQDIIAISVELGVNPSGSFDTVVERLNDISNQFSTLETSVQSQVDAFEISVQSQVDALETEVDSLTTVVMGANILLTTDIKTGAYTTTYGEVVRCDPSGGGFTVNLPTAVGAKDAEIAIKNVTNSTNTIIVDPDGSETIDGDATKEITSEYGALVLKSDNSNWMLF